MRQFTNENLKYLTFNDDLIVTDSRLYEYHCKTPAIDEPSLNDKVACITFWVKDSIAYIEDFSYTGPFTYQSLHSFHIGALLFQHFISFIINNFPSVKTVNGKLSSADCRNNWKLSIPFYLRFKYINKNPNTNIILYFRLFSDKKNRSEIILPFDNSATSIYEFTNEICNLYYNKDLYFTFEIFRD